MLADQADVDVEDSGVLLAHGETKTGKDLHVPYLQLVVYLGRIARLF